MEREEFERTFRSMKGSIDDEIREDGKRIHALVEETNKVLRVSDESTDWGCYVEFVDSVVVDGLSTAILTSLEFLLDQVDSETIRRDGKLPLFGVMLVLNGPGGLEFDPPLGHDATAGGRGMTDMIDGIVGSFFQISTLFERLDNNDGTHMEEIRSDPKITGVLSLLSEAVARNDDKCVELRRTFDRYAHLWETDLASYFEDFCKDATVVTEHGTELLDLDKFDRAIQECVDAQDEIARTPSPVDIGWLRVDITPAKREISLVATKWINLFTSHMRDSIIDTLAGLHRFMDSVTEGLGRDLAEAAAAAGGDDDAKEGDEAQSDADLLSVMSVIRDVRLKMDSVPEIFGPQRACVQILRRHGVDVLAETVGGQNLQDCLEEIPLAWDAVVKKTIKTKEDILPFQMASVDSLKVKLDSFYLSIREFRGDFR